MSAIIATPEDVKAAYRLILGRDPDPSGFEHYIKMIAEKRVLAPHLGVMFLNSAEYLRSIEGGRRIELGDFVAYANPAEPVFPHMSARGAAWERHVTKAIKANLSKGQVFVDVGANVGVMAFAAARAVGPTGRVIAFEPNEQNAQLFLRGLLANEFQAFVTLHRLALSDGSGVFVVRGSMNSYLSAAKDSGKLAQAVRGDDLLGGEPAIHLIKLDIEGHEPRALAGLSGVIRAHRPKILCEFHPKCLREHAGVDAADFAAQVFDMTREATVIDPDGSTTTVSTPRQLTDLWASRNERLINDAGFADGILHFDLLFDTSLAIQARRPARTKAKSNSVELRPDSN